MSMQMINWDELEDSSGNSFGQKFTGGKKTALAIGVFDGLHRGHQALIAKITEKAPEFLPTVVTFRENPKKFAFLRNKMPNKKEKTETIQNDIISFEEKIALLESYGAELCVIIDFSENFSKISGRAFLEALNRNLCPAYIGLGGNFHCGYHRDTDARAFKAMAESLGIKVEIIPSVMEEGLPVSSSRIRAALNAGRIKEAELLLGRSLHRFQGV